MGGVARFIHRIVIKLNLEEFFVGLRRRVNVVRKFIPLSLRHKFSSVGRFIPKSGSYSQDDSYLLTREYTRFRINRSDYVQWRLFYGVRDLYLFQAIKLTTPNSIVLDIGANFGSFTLRLASSVFRADLRNVRIYAFEPNPVMVEKLNHNLSLNPHLTNIVNVHSVGMGNHTGKLPFRYDQSNSGAGRILNKEHQKAILIDIDTIDNFLCTIEVEKISFIKMIVEGFEPHVFKGAIKTIEKFKPPIFFEVTPSWYEENNSSLSEIINPLKELGYSLYGELHNELIPYDPHKFDPLVQYNMYAVVEQGMQ